MNGNEIPQTDVLLVEGSASDAQSLRQFLADGSAAGFRPIWAERLSTALDRLAAERVGAILLNLSLPDSQGLETYRRIHTLVPMVPIIILCGLVDEALAIQAVRQGAQDYLVKDEIDTRTLQRSLRHAIERQQAQERFQLAVESAPNAMLMADQAGAIVLVNSQTEKLFGYLREELMGQSIEMLVPDRFRAVHPRHFQDFMASPRTRGMGMSEGRDLFGQRKDGSSFPIELGLNPIKTGNGVLVLASIVDITQRKRAEETHHTLAAIVEASDDAIIGKDVEGVIFSWNSGAERIYGYTADEMIGRCISDLIPPERKGEGVDILGRIRRGERVDHFDTIRVRKGGERIDVSLTVSPIKDASGNVTGASTIARDITERKRAEERLLQAERLTAIGKAMAGLAHESRNALQRSQASLEMLARRVQERPEVLELVTDIQKAQEDLHQLYEGVRDYAAPIRLDPKPYDLSDIMQETWANLALVRAGRTTRLRENAIDVDLNCEVDGLAIRQVFRNILENSLAACHDPVEIDVCYSNAEIEGRPAVQLELSNNGPRLTAQQREMIFEEFYTTKTHGTGLGMAIAKRFVEAHGGEIRVGSKSGRNAKILITLPRRLP